jgi:hypothetical protein
VNNHSNGIRPERVIEDAHTSKQFLLKPIKSSRRGADNTGYRLEKNYQRTPKKPGESLGEAVEIFNTRGFVHVDFRHLTKGASARTSDKRIFLQIYKAEEACQLASVLMHAAFMAMKVSEHPFYFCTTKDKARCQINAVYEDIETTNQRMNKRAAHLELSRLFTRMVETCTEEDFIRHLASELIQWADHEGDEYAQHCALNTAAALGMIAPSKLNG